MKFFELGTVRNKRVKPLWCKTWWLADWTRDSAGREFERSYIDFSRCLCVNNLIHSARCSVPLLAVFMDRHMQAEGPQRFVYQLAIETVKASCYKYLCITASDQNLTPTQQSIQSYNIVVSHAWKDSYNRWGKCIGHQSTCRLTDPTSTTRSVLRIHESIIG